LWRLRAVAGTLLRAAAATAVHRRGRRSHSARKGGVEARAVAGACGIAGAPHEALEIDLLHHAVGDQVGIGALVGLDDHIDQLLLHRVLHPGPELAAQAGGQPLLHQQPGQRLGLEHVLRIEFVRAFEVLDAQAQIAELEARLVVNHLREARGEDVGLDHLVADQLEPQRRGKGRQSAGGRSGAERLAPARLRERHPLGGLALERHEVVAVLLHGAGVAHLGGQLRQPVADRAGQRDDGPFRGQYETLTRLACELQGRGGPRNAH
jgi:hypothetical protein